MFETIEQLLATEATGCWLQPNICNKPSKQRSSVLIVLVNDEAVLFLSVSAMTDFKQR